MLRLVYLGYVLLALALSALTAHTAPTLPAERKFWAMRWPMPKRGAV